MNWINYLLQVNLYLILTFGFYWLVQRRETFYNANRFYLVVASLLAFGIPFWQSGIIQSWSVTEQVSSAVSVIPLQEFTITNLKEEPTWNWNLLLVSIYFFGFGFGLLRFSIGLFKLQQLFNLPNLDGHAFSVFGKIFIDKKLEDYQTIKNHEEVHSKQFHSLDVFWFELLGVVCWFNPISHFMQKEIKLVHEYIADENAALILGSKKAYAQVLVGSHFKANGNVLVNSFYNKSILKTRIMMLNKQKSKKNALLKYGLIAPLFLGMLIVSAAENGVKPKLKDSNLSITQDTVIVSNLLLKNTDLDKIIYTSVEENPKYIGGTSAMYKFIVDNMRYPMEAQNTKIQGRVFVRFIVDKNGQARNPEILKSIGYGCDEEAIRIVNMMPKWQAGIQNGKPVNVYFTMPFFFQLED